MTDAPETFEYLLEVANADDPAAYLELAKLVEAELDEEFQGPIKSTHRGPGGDAIQLLFPREDVLLSRLKTIHFTVDPIEYPASDNDYASLYYKVKGKVLYEEKWDPRDEAHHMRPIPKVVLDALKPGSTVEYGFPLQPRAEQATQRQDQVQGRGGQPRRARDHKGHPPQDVPAPAGARAGSADRRHPAEQAPVHGCGPPILERCTALA